MLGTSREAGEVVCVKHMHCSQSSGATYRQRPRTVVEAASNAVPTNDRVKQLFLHLSLPLSCVLAKMLQTKCRRLSSRRNWRLCGRVYEAENIVEDVVAAAVLLEVECLGEAHGPL